jgi:hypothetical protein
MMISSNIPPKRAGGTTGAFTPPLERIQGPVCASLDAISKADARHRMR